MIRASMKTVASLSLAAGVLAGASAVQAADVYFDVTGSYGANGQLVNGFDFLPGNTVAVGSVNTQVGDSFDVYYQSRISSFLDGDDSVVNGSDNSSYWITAVAKFSEKHGTPGPLDGPGTVRFAEGDAVGSEYFEIWIHSSNPNDVAGTGFGETPTSELLLRFTNVEVISGSFTLADLTPVQNVDGSWTLAGTGSTYVSATHGGTVDDYVNDKYFQGVNAGDAISAVLSQPVFTQTPHADNSAVAQDFWDALLGDMAFGPGGPDLGDINGLSHAIWALLDAGQQAAIRNMLGLAPGQDPEFGNDFQFQTNGKVVFETTNTPVIPEPATAAMGLIGLAGLALASRRRR